MFYKIYRFVRKNILLFGLTVLLFSIFINIPIWMTTQNKIFTNLNDIPQTETALLLGTNKYLMNGHINMFYKNRIQATFELWKNQKIKKIILSGSKDGGYDEVGNMKKDLQKLGIPENIFLLDKKGNRTSESILNLKKNNYNNILIISQTFHLERAIFLSHLYGINSLGYVAESPNFLSSIKVYLREIFARIKLIFVDILFILNNKDISVRNTYIIGKQEIRVDKKEKTIEEKKKVNTKEDKKLIENMNWKRIYELAENRGYKKREEIKQENLVKKFGIYLYSKTMNDFTKMKKEMSENNLKLNLISGFRSIKHQKNIFERKVKKKCGQLAKCKDEDILNILKVSSPPGYSKHHTGKAFDVSCGSNYLLVYEFKNTGCYKWLAQNNFENARRFNFVPSYPEGKEKQGPNPEPWEFIWNTI